MYSGRPYIHYALQVFHYIHFPTIMLHDSTLYVHFRLGVGPMVFHAKDYRHLWHSRRLEILVDTVPGLVCLLTVATHDSILAAFLPIGIDVTCSNVIGI